MNLTPLFENIWTFFCLVCHLLEKKIHAYQRAPHYIRYYLCLVGVNYIQNMSSWLHNIVNRGIDELRTYIHNVMQSCHTKAFEDQETLPGMCSVIIH